MSNLFKLKSNDFENESLQIHNDFRLEHGSPPLVINRDISKEAQKWAEELARRDEMAYSLNEKYGESVYCGWSSDSITKVKPRDCVSKWYNEINDYSFSKEPKILTCGHFTQMIWKNSRELGVGHAKSKTGKLYVVAYYYPPGNISGQFANNVPPPGALQFKTNATKNKNSISPSSTNTKTRFGDISTGLKNVFISTDSTKEKRLSTDKIKKDDAKSQVSKTDKYEYGSTTKASNDENFDQDFLDAHNYYRRKHGVPPLVLNKKLSQFAEDWAKTLVKMERGRSCMEHRPNNNYGENIFCSWSSDPNFVLRGKEPVDAWYKEIKDHVFGTEPSGLESGHFTQVVWQDSREVGVGVARSKNSNVYVVANYDPPGNFMGCFSEKVPPPID